MGKQGNANVCPMCGADNMQDEDEHADWITWYYYKDPVYGDGSLWDRLPLKPEELELIKEFKAPPKDVNGNFDAAKAELRKYVPDAFPETKWYYYKEGGGMLDNTLSSHFTSLYTFDATDLEDAKRQLKKLLPNSPLFNQTPKVQCPYCFSTQIQMVPKKFSIWTGFLTNGYNRVCLRCQRKF